MNKACEVEGCGAPYHAKGFCKPHYKKFLKYGDPLVDKRIGNCETCGKEFFCQAANRIFCLECADQRNRDSETRRRQRVYVPALEGECEICGVWGLLCQDHDHRCCDKPKRRFYSNTYCGLCDRGQICKKCNSALGLLQDDVKIIGSALRYMEKWQLTEE